MHKIKQEGYYH